MKNLAKMMMSKKRRIPVSADGIKLKKGSKVFYVCTSNGGKTWYVDETIVTRTNQRGMVALDLWENLLWYYALPPSEMVGDHRIYASESNAKEEVYRRNRQVKRSNRLK